MFKTRGGGGQRLFEQCSKKTADLVEDGTPYLDSFDASAVEVTTAATRIIKYVKFPAMSARSEKPI